MRKEFYIFRHGQTDWNVGKIVQGHSDIPLNKTGMEQAKLLGEFIKNLNLERVYSSDLLRAKQTAEIAIKDKCQIITSANLREANFGEAEGKTIDQVKEIYGEDFWNQFRLFTGGLNLKFPGGEGRADSINRIKKFLMTIAENEKATRIGISTHGGVVRNFIYSIREKNMRTVPIPNCVVYKVDYYSDQDLWKTTDPIFFIGEEKDL